MNVETNRLVEYGSIASMQLPADFVPSNNDDAGTDHKAALEFVCTQSATTTIGVWHTTFDKTLLPALDKVLGNDGPHASSDLNTRLLSDDEYFQISSIMVPGPWSGDGRNHELSLATIDVSGKRALAYEYWRTKDPANDSPHAVMLPDDIKGTAVFFPNRQNCFVDVIWIRADCARFDRVINAFLQMLESIIWK